MCLTRRKNAWRAAAWKGRPRLVDDQVLARFKRCPRQPRKADQLERTDMVETGLGRIAAACIIRLLKSLIHSPHLISMQLARARLSAGRFIRSARLWRCCAPGQLASLRRQDVLRMAADCSLPASFAVGLGDRPGRHLHRGAWPPYGLRGDDLAAGGMVFADASRLERPLAGRSGKPR